MRTMVFAFRGDVLVMAHSDKDPSTEEWTEMVSAAAKSGYARAFILTGGGSPNAKQRGELSRLVDEGMSNAPTAIITRSVAQRMITTAVAWLGLNVRAFPPEDVESALNFIGLTDPEARSETMNAALDLKAQLLGFSDLGEFAKGQESFEVARRRLLTEPLKELKAAG